MGLLNMFGGDAERIISLDTKTVGIVTDVRECWWLGGGSAPAMADGFVSEPAPHLIYFEYSVEGKRYSGSRFVGSDGRFPDIGEELTVFYDPENPRNYAIKV